MKLSKTTCATWFLWTFMVAAQAETVITLPEGATEHFTVQNASLAPLLRANANGIVSGTNVSLGSMGSSLFLVAGTQTVARFLSDSFGGSLVVCTNEISSPGANFIAGKTNQIFFSPYASILGGSENFIVYANDLASYHSVIGGGNKNAIYGSQKAVIGGGSLNVVSNHALYATIGGGFRNQVTCRSGTIPGGENNLAAASNTFAAGQSAHALHEGAFVWADRSATNAVASSNANEFVVRAAGGVRLEAELGVAPLPNKKNRYADNNIVAWANVNANGSIAANHFGVETCTSFGQGNYEILLDVSMASPATLIPVATANLFGLPLPTNAANARLIYVERTLEPNRFIVRTTTGAFVPTNTAFNFIVTGR